MPTRPFVDTNIFLRHLLQDHDDHSRRATRYIARIEQGELIVETTLTVVFETVFTLEKFFRYPRPQIQDAVLSLVELPGISLDGKHRLSRAFDLYTNSRLSFADCFHIALAEAWEAPEFVSFDREIDRWTRVRRIEL